MENVDKELKEYLGNAAKTRKIYEQSAHAEGEKVPQELIRKVKNLMNATRRVSCPHCGKGITPFKKPIAKQFFWNIIWLSGAAAAFAFSFVFRRFFLQFLVAALLFGVKWIVDQKAARTQILIYKALKENQETLPKSRDLHQPESHL